MRDLKRERVAWTLWSVAVALGAGAAHAQIPPIPTPPRHVGAETVFVPKWQPGPDAWEGSSAFIAPKWNHLPARVQIAYAVEELEVTRAMIAAIAFRKPRQWKSQPAVTFTTTVTLSHSPRAPSAITARFPDNVGADASIVFQGTVTWPAILEGPDAGQFTSTIKFDRPFPFDATKGRSLVFDCYTVFSTLPTPSEPRLYAQAHRDTGRQEFNMQDGCSAANYCGCCPSPWMPGGQYCIAWAFLPPRAPCLLALGYEGVGGKWGNLTLPFRLWGRCFLAIAPSILIPFTADATGMGPNIAVPIPQDNRLVGARLYDQCVVYDSSSPNPILTTRSYSYLIGSGHAPNAAVVEKPLYNNVEDGLLRPQMAPIARLQMQ